MSPESIGSSQAKDLPYISPELWLNILRFATEVPDSLERPQALYSNYRRPTKWATERYEVSLATKRGLVTVCRQWNALTTTFLYEHVTTNTSNQLESVLNTVSLPQNLGHLVKRLDLLITSPVVHWKSTPEAGVDPEGPRTYSPAAKLCSLLPNLVALTAAYDVVDSFPLSVSAVVSPKLTYMACLDYGRVTVSDWIEFVDRHPHLSYLDLPILESWRTPNLDKLEGIKLAEGNTYPSLTEVAFDGADDLQIIVEQICPGVFPHLQKLTMHRNIPAAQLATFMAGHGQKMKSIHLPYFHYGPREASPGFSDALFEMLKLECPQLEEILVSIGADEFTQEPPTWVTSVDAEATQLPGVTTVGVEFLEWGEATDKSWEWLFENTIYWKKLLPDLRTIHFFEEGTVTGIRDTFYLGDVRTTFTPFLEQCKELGIRVEDHFGREMVPTSLE